MTEQQAVPIAAGDRVSDLFQRYPGSEGALIDAFVRHSSHFGALRNPITRRVMTRLVTVEQAAKICSVGVPLLLRDLNRAVGIEVEGGPPAPEAGPGAPAAAAAPAAPEEHAGRPVPAGEVVELDVRDDLRQGREPFSRIMAAVAALGSDQTLHLHTTFEPVPLFTVMAKRGFTHRAEAHTPDDWSVWFFRTTGEPGAPGSPAERAESAAATPDAGAPAPGVRPDDIVLDVRGLEPPEPLVRTLEALERLPRGRTLVQVNVRIPQHLLPLLRERGFEYTLEQSRPDLVTVHIQHAPQGGA